MDIYHYDSVTHEFLSAGSANPNPLEPGEWLKPAHATFSANPSAGTNEVAVYGVLSASWSLKSDFRGTEYYDKDYSGESKPDPIVITSIGAEVPANGTLSTPDEEIYVARWSTAGATWVENATIFEDQKVVTKADVDLITKARITALGEEKAKTEFLKALEASSSTPQIWLDFVASRDAIVAEGNAFIISNGL